MVGCSQADFAEAKRSDLSSSMQLMFYNAPEVSGERRRRERSGRGEGRQEDGGGGGGGGEE